MAYAGEVFVKVKGDASHFNKTMDNLSKKIDAAANFIKTAFDLVLIERAISLVYELNTSFGEAEQAMIRLNNAAKNNKLLSGSFSKNIDAFATKMQKLTGINDEAIKNQAAFSASLGLTEDQIKKLLQAAANWASTGQISFESAATMLARTYTGMGGMLSRMIPGMKELTKEQLMQGKAIDFVAERFKDGAATIHDSLLGSRNSIANSFDDFKESMGKFTAPIEKEFNLMISNILDNISVLYSDLFNVEDIKAALSDLRSTVEPILMNLAESLKPVVKLLGEVVSLFSKIYKAGMDFAAPLITVLTTLFKGILDPVIWLVTYLDRLSSLLTGLPKAMGGLEKIAETLKPVLDAIGAISNLPSMLGSILKNLEGLYMFFTGKSEAEVRKFMEGGGSTSGAGKVEPIVPSPIVLPKTGTESGSETGAAKYTGEFNGYLDKFKDFVKKEKQIFEERTANIKKFTDLGKTYFGDLFSKLGESLVIGGNAWYDFARAAVDGIAAIIDALSNEALAEAAMNLAKGIAASASAAASAATFNYIGAAQWTAAASGFYGAAAQWGAAGLAGKLGAGIVRGLASLIQAPKMATGGVIMARPGGTLVTMAEAGVNEYAVPDRSNVWNQIADRISANMGNTIYNTNNTNLPGTLVLRIGEKDIATAITDMSRDRKIIIDPKSIAKRS